MKEGYKFTWSEIEMLKINWNQLSLKNNGKFKSIKSFKHSITRRFELEIPYSSGKIILKTDEFKPLKIKYKFKKKYSEHFIIYPEDITDKIEKIFGLKEFEIGIKTFDNKFILKGNSKDLIFDILTLTMRKYLLNHYISNFKLENVKNKTYLELNIVLNELDNSEMNDCINIFKKCIDIIEIE